MTISDQAPPLELLPTRQRPAAHRQGRLPGPRLAGLQVDPEALVFGGGRLRLRALIERPDERRVSLWLRLAGADYEVPVRGCAAETEIELADVEWWWPAAHGLPTRHLVRISLLDQDAEVLDTSERRIGFRWAQWATEPDRSGNPCILVVNGQPVRVRGVDWTVPPTPERPGRQANERRLRALRRAGVNLLRIRDGRFESDDFYDLCDQLGMLVWQDLSSPRRIDGAAGRTALETRVRSGLVRVSSHPAIVLLHLSEGAPAGLQHIATELAPQIPVAVEPARLHAAGPDPSVPPLRRQPRFVTMLGSPPAPSSGDGTSGELAAALDLAADLIGSRLRPDDRAGVVIGRPSAAPGSAIDGSGLLTQVVGRACADRELVLAADGPGVALTMLNDDAEAFAGQLRIRRFSAAGAELGDWETDLLVWSHSAETIRLPDFLVPATEGPAELILAEAGGLRAAWFAGDPGSLTRPRWRLSTVPGPEWVRVLATPDVLVLDACLVAAPGFEIQGGPVTLLPGETAEFRMPADACPVAELRRSLAVVCRNDLTGRESPQQVPPPPADRD